MIVDPCIAHRSLLFTVAYEMLGSAADAEDVLQETWLRWAEVDRSQIHDPRAYLVRAVTRQALNRIRTLSRRREDYVGEWLPEPLLTHPDVADDVELAESVSIAMLTVLETLGPTERAVFVLREVFDVPYEEVAEAVGKTPLRFGRSPGGPGTTSPLGSHASASAGRSTRPWWPGSSPRCAPGASRTSWRSWHRTWSSSLTAAGSPAPHWPPSTGPPSWRRCSCGTDRAAFETMAVWLNGAPAIRIESDSGRAAVSLVVENGRITRIYATSNPEKLTRLDNPADLTR